LISKINNPNFLSEEDIQQMEQAQRASKTEDLDIHDKDIVKLDKTEEELKQDEQDFPGLGGGNGGEAVVD
jgi:hypothetical protein